jgi:RecB family exonuclease
MAKQLGVEIYARWRAHRRGVMAVGRFDRVCLLDDGMIEIVDLKTSKRVLTQEEAEREPQTIPYKSIAADIYADLKPKAIAMTYLFVAEGLVPVTVTPDRESLIAKWDQLEEVINDVFDKRKGVLKA